MSDTDINQELSIDDLTVMSGGSDSNSFKRVRCQCGAVIMVNTDSDTVHCSSCNGDYPLSDLF